MFFSVLDVEYSIDASTFSGSGPGIPASCRARRGFRNQLAAGSFQPMGCGSTAKSEIIFQNFCKREAGLRGNGKLSTSSRPAAT
jgi:hypothetical protein